MWKEKLQMDNKCSILNIMNEVIMEVMYLSSDQKGVY